MGRENKKEGVAKLHREAILAAAEKLFTEKGFVETTISDISAASDYSRRTIYAYCLNKDDILHHIIGKGLISLRDDVKNALDESEDFLTRYEHICKALKKYYEDCPLSAENIINAETGKPSSDELTPAVKNIFNLGEDINHLLAKFIEDGKTAGAVQSSTRTMPTVYVLWSSISSLLTLVKTKGRFLSDSLALSQDEFMEYGFRQIINSILVERI